MLKKICFFIGYYPYVKGGAEYQAKLIADKLKDKFEIFFISVSNSHIDYGIEVHEGYKVYKINYNLKLNKILLYFPLSKEINKILDIEKPDIIYQRILNSFSYHLSKYGSKHSISYFIHIADKYSLIFDDNSLSTKVRKSFFKYIISTNTKFITQNSEQTELLRIQNSKSVLEVYNMHPIPSFNFQEKFDLKLKNKIKNIVWIGNARQVKRLELFLKLAEECTDLSNLKFYVIGRIDETDYGYSLKKYIDRLNNVEFLGEKDNIFVNEFLQNNAYLAVNTSLSEGFSNVYIQSWLRGIPVLSLNSNPDNLFNKYNLGYFFNDNFSEIKEKIIRLVSDVELYNIVANDSLNISKKLFSLETSIKKIENLL